MLCDFLFYFIFQDVVGVFCLCVCVCVCVCVFFFYFVFCSQRVFKKNLNAPRPSEHPPVRGENVKTFRGGIIGCKDKTSSWHLNGSPDGSDIGSTEQCRGEAHRYTAHLHY